jgi:hypothetical protein
MMNPIYLILVGVVIITFWVARSMVILIDKSLERKKPTRLFYFLLDGFVWFSILLMVFVSMALSAFWYGILSIIIESVFSKEFKYPHLITEDDLIIYLTIFYFFCYSLVSFAIATHSIANKKINSN